MITLISLVFLVCLKTFLYDYTLYPNPLLCVWRWVSFSDQWANRNVNKLVKDLVRNSTTKGLVFRNVPRHIATINIPSNFGFKQITVRTLPANQWEQIAFHKCQLLQCSVPNTSLPIPFKIHLHNIINWYLICSDANSRSLTLNFAVWYLWTMAPLTTDISSYPIFAFWLHLFCFSSRQ